VWSGRVLTALLCVTAVALAAHPSTWLPGARLPALDRIPLALALVLLAHGLAGRRRLALQVTLGLVVIAVLPPVHPAQLVVPAAAALLLLPGHYPVRPDPQRLRTAMLAAGAALAVVLARGVWEASWHRAPVRQAAWAALPFPPDAPDRSTRVFVVVVLAAVIVALAVALASSPAPPPAERAMAARAGAHTVEVASSHVAMISHAPEVVDLIAAAADAAE
jgi:hypothetical protein